MLKSFSVRGYKNFATRVTLDLSDTREYRFNSDALNRGIVKTSLLYGRNGIGKTNFIRAIMDVKRTVFERHSLSRPISGQDYLNANSNARTATFEYVFTFGGKEVSYIYEKEGPETIVDEKLAVDGALVLDRGPAWAFVDLRDISPGTGGNLNLERFDPDMSLLGYVFANTLSHELGVLDDLYDFIMGMGSILTTSDAHDISFLDGLAGFVIKSGKVEELEAFLNRFGIEERLQVIDSPSGEPALYLDHGRPISFAANCSSGTVALLRLFEHRCGKEPSLLMVDEFDAFYHHDLAEKVLDLFKGSAGGQTICATHNTDLFSNKTLRPDCLFIMSRDAIKSATNATKRELREGHNLEKLYKAGEFDV